MNKEVKLQGGLYTLEYEERGYGGWATSKEKNVIPGTVRVIGGMLMHAIDRDYHMGIGTFVRWVPVVAEKVKCPGDFKKWVDSL